MTRNVDWMNDAQRSKWATMWRQMTELQKERQPIAKKLMASKTARGPNRQEFRRLLELNRRIVALDEKQRALLDEHPMKRLIQALTKPEPQSAG